MLMLETSICLGRYVLEMMLVFVHSNSYPAMGLLAPVLESDTHMSGFLLRICCKE